MGTITLELDHVNAPMATANFIGLASGAFNWIDSETGLLKSNTPYYDGIIFHRVIAGFMNQSGSQNGLDTDGPGYSFQDGNEINNGLNHAQAYRISMANSGPNTNDSQFFLTAAATSWLDGKHIVFGQVSASGNSRSIVDDINQVAVVDADGPDNIPNNGDEDHRPVVPVVIDSVTVNYNGVDFDPFAQGLPLVSGQALDSPVTATTTSLIFTQAPGTDFHLAYSADLSTWNRSETRSIFQDESPLTSFEMPNDSIGQAQQFYLPALVSYNYAITPAPSLANRTLTLSTAVDPEVSFAFTFDTNGVTGTWSYPREVDPLSGAISDSLYVRDHLGGRLIMILSEINVPNWNLRRIGYDQETGTFLSGRHTGTASDPEDPFQPTLTIDGTFTLTK